MICSKKYFHIYSANFHSMAKKPVQISRIMYPATSEGWRDLIVGISAKHTLDGPTSVLKSYVTENNINFTNLIAEANDAFLRMSGYMPMPKHAQTNITVVQQNANATT